ncbi:proteasome assembly chaperone 2 [Erpetoichthys calabaricus]|uniref:Proteasome assembly chaperone 2 n=1 Tax=Erpetoichthys calabaricus TaxID=27687 RepID=A0A8C4SXE9_ERPCA|nr:proteasome assembly chaperone 2 [Erpetoichthys calabaricus]
MFVPVENASPTFKDSILIMPAVSVGNVGQLAVDLLISTLNMPCVGYIHTDCLIPMVGNHPYATSEENSSELSTNAEVYFLPEKKLAVLQIRSPTVKSKTRQFRHLILSWIKSNQFSRSILLSSSHAYQCDDRQLSGSPLRYLQTLEMKNIIGDELQKLDLKELETTPAFPGISETEQRLWIPGGGITKRFFTECSSEHIPLAVLLIFCSEGDNIPEAFTLINFLNRWLHLVETTGAVESHNWKIPCSWKLLFGSGIPPAIF